MSDDEGGPLTPAQLTTLTNEQTAKIHSLATEVDKLKESSDGIELTLDALADTVNGAVSDSITTAIDPVLTTVEKLAADVAQLQATPLPPVFAPAPTVPSAVQAALLPANRTSSLEKWGVAWVNSSSVRSLWPADLIHDQAFINKLCTSSPSKQITPQDKETVSANTATVNAAAAIQKPVTTVATASDDLPVKPFGSARNLKIEIAAPSQFSQVSINSIDIEDWLDRVLENCKFGQLSPDLWVYYATSYLGGSPLSEWNAYKKTANKTGLQDDIMQWASFVAWCRKHYTLPDRKKLAYDKLKSFKQIGSVSKYVSAFNLLCAETNLSEEHQLYCWYDGLKPDIRSKTEVHPVTLERHTCLDDAQRAALAHDSFHIAHGNAGAPVSFTPVTPGKKRHYDTGSTSSDIQMLEPTAKRLSFDRPNRPTGKVSRPQVQQSGFIFYPLDGTVLIRERPASVIPILDQIKANTLRVPEHLLIPIPEGQSRRPGGGQCWMRGCHLAHNMASCPRLMNYLQRYPNMDAPMPNEWVRPVSADNNNGKNRNNRRTGRRQ